MTNKELTDKKATVLGVIFIGGGGSWYQGADQVKCAFECAKVCKRDWGNLFKFKRKQDFAVNLYDISKLSLNDEWHINCLRLSVKDNEDNDLRHIKTLHVAV